MNVSPLLRVTQSVSILSRSLNCWTAAITRKHRKVYEQTYPTVLVLSDGSSINMEYHEPRKIIILPLDLTKLSDAERRARLEKRKPKTKIVLQDDIEDDFDENRYLHLAKKV